MDKIHFFKMQGVGNDFVIIDARDEEIPPKLSPQKRQKICDRHFGVGCDQLIILKKPHNKDKAHIFMEIYNADGQRAEACGNAARCVAWLLFNHEKFYIPTNGLLYIETDSGIFEASTKAGQAIEINLGMPKFEWEEIPLSRPLKTDRLSFPKYEDLLGKGFAVNLGNPHLVFFVKKLSQIDLQTLGTYFSERAIFPKGINIEFAEIIDEKKINALVWERGCGKTLACGTGAAAIAIAAIKKGLVSSNSLTILMPGGRLKAYWKEGGPVSISGAVEYVFQGTLSETF